MLTGVVCNALIFALNSCLIGDIDPAKDASIDWKTLNVDGIPDVRHN